MRTALVALAASLVGGPAEPKKLAVYIGSYGPSIHRFELDLASGAVTDATAAGEIKNPSFLEIHPSGKYLYAVGEVGGKKGGAVAAFEIAKDGSLKLLNEQTSGGNGPCHISLAHGGKVALVANYGGGSVESLPIGDDGKLGEPATFVQHQGSSVNKGRQSAPHAHSINPSPDGRFALCADLGLDQVLVYTLDASGKMAPNNPPHAATPPGSGPRHFAFHPSGKYVYVCGEMTSTVHAYAWDGQKGALSELQSLSTLPEEVKGNSTAEVVAHPSGKAVYVSNRGHDSIAVFAVDEATGKLTAKGHVPTGGKTPRNFAVDPTGRYLLAANQNSDTVTVFKVDPSTGALTATGASVKVPKPVCVRFLPLQ
ncbi:MAG TPA: lactonase family protein [Planctomycetota bacterium]|nr:lactonase family protein [Planctomycetota bacterium]